VPSQQQLRWSQLKVGITVVVATIILAVLIFLMSGSAGIFTKKLTLIAYYDNAEGLIVGAPVALQGVTIGNVSDIKVVANHMPEPVQIVMKVNTKYRFLLRKDTKATIQTAGVLGQSFIDLDSKEAKEPVVEDYAILKSGYAPALGEVVRASQTTMQNIDVLVKRVDHIVQDIESSKGTLGKVITDPSLFNRANAMLGQIQGLINDVNNGKGTIGQLFKDDSLARRLNASLDKVNRMIDDINEGKGTAGKFLKDESLYNNANQMVAKANKLIDDVNAGKGPVGKLLKDEELAKKLDNTITRLSSIADKLDNGQGTFAKLVQDPAVYNHTEQLMMETRGLIKSIREDPKKYLTIHLKIF